MLLVGGTDTGCRHWSPTSPFPVPHSRLLRPKTLEVPGMGLRLRDYRSVYYFRTCVLVCSVLGEFPTEPVTREAHPYPPQVRARRMFRYHRLVPSRVATVRARRTFHYRRPVRSRVTVVLDQHLQQCSFFSQLY
ncbi:hypothetical protein Taro_027375 [Colocasia esculenta]|uniref:Uncharacterized protein n=1 Tax=Colocasia esculenta TaxID=4460 RepID=A0A843VJY6_COLES|nr:hypothetical protein [Colocasia esculenta]